MSFSSSTFTRYPFLPLMVTRLWKGEKFVVTNGNPEANASKIDIFPLKMMALQIMQTF